MIQRIQSIWLALASLAALLTLKFSFFSGNKLEAASQAKNFVRQTAAQNFLTLILTVGVAVTAAIVIFLYKNRKLQLRLTLLALVISLLNLFLYYNDTKKFIPGEYSYDLTAIISLIIPLLLGLAIRGIYHDEKLIKSTERLR
jgi:lipopolysaccharide export LptBFGC system permease protein LptF